MIVAITGGIGSGKSYLCRLLEQRGVQVYDCDAAAKRLMRSSMKLQRRISELVGEDVFPGGQLQKSLLAQFLLRSGQNAQALDSLVHPAVAADFLSSGLQWMETAILFESRFERRVQPDHVVCVTAPVEVRLARVMSRDHITREKAQEWMRRQLPQDEVRARSDFEIVNDGVLPFEEQVDAVLKAIFSQETKQKQK